jgi:DNA-3-methyladenine glycosylase
MSQNPVKKNFSMNFLNQDAVTVAQRLIGCRLYVVELGGARVGGVIVETEAYTQEDAASHSYRGKTPRTEVMFGPAGHIYVYFTYGMHWCMNIVAGPEGRGEGVLIRAIKPDSGLDIIRERRGNRPDPELTNGPAKVCQALAVTGADNASELNKKGRFLLFPPKHEMSFKATERIGIKKDTHRLWRFIAE